MGGMLQNLGSAKDDSKLTVAQRDVLRILQSQRPRYPAPMTTDAETVRLSVFGKFGSEDMESKAAPEPTRKPKISLCLFMLSLTPHV